MLTLHNTYAIGSKRKKCSLKRTTFEKNNKTIIKESFYKSSRFKVVPRSYIDIEKITSASENKDYLVISDLKDFKIVSLNDNFTTNWYSVDYDVDEIINRMYVSNMNTFKFFKINDFNVIDEEFIISDGIIIEV
jgi:hypothetical protein